MSTLATPTVPAATGAHDVRSRDKTRGHGQPPGGSDFASVLDGHLAASKKPGAAKPGAATSRADNRDDRADTEQSSPGTGPSAVAGQTPAQAAAASAATASTEPAATVAVAGDGKAVGRATSPAAVAPAPGDAAGTGGLVDDPDADAGAAVAASVPTTDGTTAATDETTNGPVTGATAAGGPASTRTTAGGGPTARGAGRTSGDTNGTGAVVETVALAEAVDPRGVTASKGARAEAANADQARTDLGAAGQTPGVAAAPATAKTDGAAGANAPTATSATPVVAQVAPAVARVVSRGDGEHRMMLKLHPADLGEIHLTVTVRGDHVDVEISAGSQARDLLRDGSAHLRSLIESIGRTPGQLVLRDLPPAQVPSPAATAGGAGPDAGSGGASYAGDGPGRGDTGRDQPGTRGGAGRPQPLVAARDTTSTRTSRTNGVQGGTALDVTV